MDMSEMVVYAMLQFLAATWIFILACIIVNIIATWRIYRKADQHGWAAVVPFYSSYVSYKIFWGNGWLFLVPIILSLFTFVPILGQLFSVANLVIYVLTCYKKSLAFGKGVAFTVGLVLLGFIFNMILAFGGSYYHGVPNDGFSYQQIKDKIEKDTPNVNYSDPDNK